MLDKPSSSSKLHCEHASTCPACTLISLTSQMQAEHKIQNLNQLWEAQLGELFVKPETQFHSIGLSEHRDYIDFTYQDQKYGFIKNKEMIPIPFCELPSKELKKIYQQFLKIHFPVSPISFRLRKFKDHHGVWIDTSNIHIKELLDEKTTLQKILDLGFSIEIGQKKKYLNPVSFKLQDSILQSWSETKNSKDKTIDLYGCISDFTQSGTLATQKINEVLFEYLKELKIQKIIEFGSGLGTLTFPLLGDSRQVTACEFNPSAVRSLKYSIEKSNPELLERIVFIEGDHQSKNLIGEFKNFDLIMLNPPRSGIKNFLNPLDPNNKPKYLVYMSCYPKTFIEDSARLRELGYQCKKIDIIDQFPNSEHYEVLSCWEDN